MEYHQNIDKLDVSQTQKDILHNIFKLAGSNQNTNDIKCDKLRDIVNNTRSNTVTKNNQLLVNDKLVVQHYKPILAQLFNVNDIKHKNPLVTNNLQLGSYINMNIEGVKNINVTENDDIINARIYF